ncbi:MAG: hypothetical protein ACI90V_000778 [Bacillariaceae sp.]|jgi:hypothetical protein
MVLDVHDDDESESWSALTEDISGVTPFYRETSSPAVVMGSIADDDDDDDNEYRTRTTIVTSTAPIETDSIISLTRSEILMGSSDDDTYTLPPPIPPPYQSQSQYEQSDEEIDDNNDAMNLTQSQQQNENQRRKIVSTGGTRLPIQSPENWQTTRRTHYNMNGEFGGVDNRTRIPGEHLLLKQQQKQKHLQQRQYDERIIDEFSEDDSVDSGNMGYLPSRHFNNPSNNKSNKQIFSSAPPPVRNNSVGMIGDHHQQQQHQTQTQTQQKQQFYTDPSTSRASDDNISPSNNSNNSRESAFSFNSNHSTVSTRSNRSSLLHGEIINLEGNVAAIATAAAASKRRQQSYGGGDGNGDRRYDNEDYDSHHQSPEELLQGMEIGGGSAFSNATGARRGGGKSMLSSQGFLPLQQQQQYQGGDGGAAFTMGAASEYISSMKQQSKQLGHDAKKGAVKFKGRATSVANDMLSKYYRPPLSPRSRELKDLQYLKQSHREKIGQWLPSNNNNISNDPNESFKSSFKDGQSNSHEVNDDNFSDFVIVLTPQEAYKYWADLLDFREEHFGMDSLDVWGRQLQSPAGASTNTTDSRTSVEEVSSEEKKKEKSDHQSAKSSDTDSNQHDDDDEAFADLSSTPLTGLLRRRVSRTPPVTKNTPTRRFSRSVTRNNDNSIQRSRFTQYSLHSQSHLYSSQSNLFSPTTPSRRGHGRMSMFERALQSPSLTTSNRSRTFSQSSYYSHSNHTSIYTDSGDEAGTISATPTNTERPSLSAVRRRWGNPTMPSQSTKSFANILSPPIRSLTRGTGSEGNHMMLSSSMNSHGNKQNSIRDNSIKINTKVVQQEANGDDEENQNPNSIQTEKDIPNPIIPRGIAARTNGMIRFLSALKRGIVVRRHRPNKDSIFCKLSSIDGGDTIQYQLIDPEEAMIAFKEQRVRYNRNLTHSSTPMSVRAISTDWSCIGGPSEGSPVHKFKVPDHVAAQKYREKFQREHGTAKRLFDVALKAANSGMVRATDIVAVHPAIHNDPRHPGLRKGELGTASLRRSLSNNSTEHTFSLISFTGQRFKKKGISENPTDTWFKGEGSELLFKTLDFEAATEGEYWLIFRGLLLLHRDAVSGRFAIDRNAGIGGGARTKTMENEKGEDGENATVENRLQQDMYVEPVMVGRLEKLIVQKIRKTDDDYIRGAVMPGAIPPPSDYFLGYKSPGTQIWSRLRLAGLETQRIYSVDTRRVMIKIRCPEDRLTDVAEVLRLRMRTKDGSFAPFREDSAHMFKEREDLLDIPNMYRDRMASLLRSKDRQMIINFIIGSRIRDSGAELAETSDVGKMIEARIPLHMPRKLDSLYNAWVYYWKREHWTGISPTLESKSTAGGSSQSAMEEGCLPGNDRDDKDQSSVDERPIPSFITRFFVEAFNQPLDSIEEYFGEKVTFYFAWLQHCAVHLLFLSFFGLMVTFFQVKNEKFDHWSRPFFSMIVMIWTFVVLVNWRKRSNSLAYQWGSMDHKEQETNRPEFQGEYVTDPITNEWVIKYPRWKRWLKYLISIPITAAFTCLSLFLILLVHANRDMQMARYVNSTLNSTLGDEHFEFNIAMNNIGLKQIVDVKVSKELLLDPTYWIIMTALPAMLGLCIPILNIILMWISVKLNDFENYRTDSE